MLAPSDRLGADISHLERFALAIKVSPLKTMVKRVQRPDAGGPDGGRKSLGQFGGRDAVAAAVDRATIGMDQ